MDLQIKGMPIPLRQLPVVEKTPSREKTDLQRVTEEFESLLLNELLKSMRSAESLLAGDEEKSAGSELHREMMDEQLARAMARGGGFGLAKMLELKLQQLNGRESR